MADWQCALGAAPRPGESWPLVAHAPHEVGHTFAWRDGRAISVARFLGDVTATAVALPDTTHAVNACNDRYAFAVAFAACLQRAILTLLPPSRTPGVLAHLCSTAPDLVLIVDAADAGHSDTIPIHRIAPDGTSAPQSSVPRYAGERLVARMFTSGSTGLPTPQPKHWGNLVRSGAAEVQRLRATLPQRVALLATVPPQHSYGFESTLLVALAGGAELCAARPFYPADIAAELAALPRPRGLVTTPFHLRTVLESGVKLPQSDLLLCATAPLSPALAQAAERAFGAPLVEIYGATETGQLATRCTAAQSRWTPLGGVHIAQDAQGAQASGNHVPLRTPLADLVELHDDGTFTLLGRQADMVNIGGKRSSLAYLTRVLLRVPGVQDAAFFLPDEPNAGAQLARVAAAVVAPGLTKRTVLGALRAELDPVFLPRPLLMVETLPRGDTGKLPVAQLRALLNARSSR